VSGPARAVENADASREPRLADRRLTDVSAVAGALVWVAVTGMATTGGVGLSTVDRFVALAVLVCVPLGLGLVSPPPGPATALHRLAVVAQLPAALAAVGALALPVGTVASVALSLPWLAVTGAAALVGLARLRARGPEPLPELAVDAALLYVPVAAVALLGHRAGVSLRFRPLIVLLTAVHFHYAGFVLPLVTGIVGRRLAGGTTETPSPDGFGDDLAGRAAAAATLVVVGNVGLIAVGITFSPLVEVVAVALFTVAVAGFAALALVRVVPALPRFPGLLLSVAFLSLFATMALALAYGYAAFRPDVALVSIGGMVRWHGTLNAFGFALPALLAVRLLES
jgi:hypothetical protein